MSEAEFNKVFSKRLKYYLSKYEMTQLDLSKKIGVGTTSVSNWCKGLKSPRMDKIDAMCKIFNCSRSDLMEDKKDSANGFSSNSMVLSAKDKRDIKKNVDNIMESLESANGEALYYDGIEVHLTDETKDLLRNALTIALQAVKLENKGKCDKTVK